MKKIILALDVNDRERAMNLVRAVSPWVDIIKVGPIVFLTEGPDIVRRIRDAGKEVFLDLKLHDIPATVQRAVESAAGIGVYSMTIHSMGGKEMIAAAASVAKRPRLWAVTVLTSQSADPEEVVRRAKLAKDSGADGVIASPLEASLVKNACGKGFSVVTPGIRSSSDAVNDQKRVATPKGAIEAGADFIVVGRPVIEAPDPAKAARSIAREIGEE